jgi:hypothetical protein
MAMLKRYNKKLSFFRGKKGIKFVQLFSGTLYHGQTLADRMNPGPSFQL